MNRTREMAVVWCVAALLEWEWDLTGNSPREGDRDPALASICFFRQSVPSHSVKTKEHRYSLMGKRCTYKITVFAFFPSTIGEGFSVLFKVWFADWCQSTT